MNPTTGVADCCARAASGHAAAAQPSSAMNARRFMCGWPRLARDNFACRTEVACGHVSGDYDNWPGSSEARFSGSRVDARGATAQATAARVEEAGRTGQKIVPVSAGKRDFDTAFA